MWFIVGRLVTTTMEYLKKTQTEEIKHPFTVLVEGNIGSGKTTFLNHFQKFDEVCLQTEPVEKWRNNAGVNLLVIINFL